MVRRPGWIARARPPAIATTAGKRPDEVPRTANRGIIAARSRPQHTLLKTGPRAGQPPDASRVESKTQPGIIQTEVNSALHCKAEMMPADTDGVMVRISTGIEMISEAATTRVETADVVRTLSAAGGDAVGAGHRADANIHVLCAPSVFAAG